MAVGLYDAYGGRYVPETLISALDEPSRRTPSRGHASSRRS
jgi:tryptophan synthase beta subunit